MIASSLTDRSGTNAYFFKSLRISFGAARLFRWDWTSHIKPIVHRRRRQEPGQPIDDPEIASISPEAKTNQSLNLG
jgi:hypothetical protein